MSKIDDVAKLHEFLKALTEETKDSTMPIQQVMLLTGLMVHRELSQQKLEELTGVKRSSNSRNISKLGIGEDPINSPGPRWVHSEEDMMDRRTKLVSLSPIGRAMMDKVWQRSFGKYSDQST